MRVGAWKRTCIVAVRTSTICFIYAKTWPEIQRAFVLRNNQKNLRAVYWRLNTITELQHESQQYHILKDYCRSLDNLLFFAEAIKVSENGSKILTSCNISVLNIAHQSDLLFLLHDLATAFTLKWIIGPKTFGLEFFVTTASQMQCWNQVLWCRMSPWTG